MLTTNRMGIFKKNYYHNSVLGSCIEWIKCVILQKRNKKYPE